MIFGGKTHRVLSYAQKTGFAIITIEDVTNINTASLGDVVARFTRTYKVRRTLRVGLNNNENAGLT